MTLGTLIKPATRADVPRLKLKLSLSKHRRNWMAFAALTSSSV